jgi:hypothetical protein
MNPITLDDELKEVLKEIVALLKEVDRKLNMVLMQPTIRMWPEPPQFGRPY